MAALMLSWELFARHRWLFATTAIYFILICLICPHFPSNWRRPDLALGLLLSPLASLVVLLASLAHASSTRLEATTSSYPVRLFTLPVSSLLLAGAPLLTGSLLCAIVWPIVTVAILRPCDVPAPYFWPAFLGMALFASVQALMWTPFPLAWLRLLIVGLLVPGLIFGSIALSHFASEGWMSAVHLAITVTAYLAAIRGVARARRATGVESSPTTFVGRIDSLECQSPFPSSVRAHLWLEWRMRRWGLVFAFGVILASGLLATHLNSIVLSRGEILPALPRVEAAVERYGVGWVSVTSLLMLPLVFGLMGADLGQFAVRRSVGVPRFFLVLPISTTSLIHYKLLFAGLLSATIWLLLLLLTVGWAAVTGHFAEMVDHLMTISGSWPGALGIVAGGLIIGVAVTWLWLASGLWGGLVGQSAISPLPVIFGIGSCLLAWMVLSAWETVHLRPWIIAILSLALVLKVVTIVWMMRQLIHRRLVGWTALVVWIVGWTILASSVIALVNHHEGGFAYVAVALLLLPLARPLSAYVMLDRVRHG